MFAKYGLSQQDCATEEFFELVTVLLSLTPARVGHDDFAILARYGFPKHRLPEIAENRPMGEFWGLSSWLLSEGIATREWHDKIYRSHW